MYTLQFGTYNFPNISFTVEGFPLDQNIQENLIARRDGAIIPQPYLNPRVFNVSGKIYKADQPTAITDLLAMQAALLKQGTDQFFYRSDRYINCWCKQIKPVPELGTDMAVMNVDLAFEASDPYFYAAGLSITDTLSAPGGTYNFNVNGNGNVFSEPIIYILPVGATITNNMQLKNNVTGKTFAYSGVVGIGQTVLFDSTQLSVNYQSADGLSYFSGDFLTIVAGSNVFQYVGGAATIKVEHKDRWYN